MENRKPTEAGFLLVGSAVQCTSVNFCIFSSGIFLYTKSKTTKIINKVPVILKNILA